MTDSQSPQPALVWHGLSQAEVLKVVGEICDYGTGFVAPLISVVENIDKLLRERNATAPVPIPASEGGPDHTAVLRQALESLAAVVLNAERDGFASEKTVAVALQMATPESPLGQMRDAIAALAAQPQSTHPADPSKSPSAIDTSPAEGDEHPAELVCAQAYQVVGSLLDDLGQFGTALADKILDNLSEARIVHDDVLPWPSFANVQPKHKECATFPPHQRCAECAPDGASECDLEALLYALQQGESLSTDQRSAIWTRLQAPAPAQADLALKELLLTAIDQLRLAGDKESVRIAGLCESGLDDATQAPAVGAEWQPIETAPKDGTHILVWTDASDTAYVVCWADAALGIRKYLTAESGAERGWHLAWDGELFDREHEPTHWMPLPDAPGSYVPVQGSQA